MIQNNQITFNNFTLRKYLSSGSFASCVLADHPVYNECALVISSNQIELQHRMNFQLNRHLKCISKSYELFEIKVTNEDKISAEKIIPGVLNEGIQYVLAMEYFDTSLTQYLKRSSASQKIQIFHKLLEAMADWHSKQFFHLDLKPANIFVVNNEPVLIDFGLSYAPGCNIYNTLPVYDPLMEKHEIVINSIPNTGAYAPCHDVFASYVAASKFDVYCLGSMLYEDLLGTLPKEPLMRQTIITTKLNSLLGIQTADLLIGMLLKDQTLRYSLSQCIQHPFFTNILNKNKNSLILFQFKEHAERYIQLQRSLNQKQSVDDCIISNLKCNYKLFDDQEKLRLENIQQLFDVQNEKLLQLLRKQQINYQFHSQIVFEKYTENTPLGSRSFLDSFSQEDMKIQKSFSTIKKLQRSLKVSQIQSLKLNIPEQLDFTQLQTPVAITAFPMSFMQTPRQADITLWDEDC
ncbi:Kinase [Hexamita inflata]|uniref:CAMK CAMKL n=1 Tax=Hexamita inflata TaxID=28002 RepID=A0AA86U7F3_9EUKA|nr:CAMK CAMKL [Hexamita inflata]